MALDTTQLFDITPPEAAIIDSRKALARAELEPVAQAVRQAWLKARREEIAAAGGDVSPDALLAALDTKVLPGAFVLHVESAERRGTFDRLTVAQILRDPIRYDGRRTRDPLDPDYQEGASVATLLLRGKQKRVRSFASGGTDYVLEDRRPVILLEAGGTHHAVEDVLSHLREGTKVFDFGTQLVRVIDGRMEELNDLTFGHFVAEEASFIRCERSRKGEITERPVDPPARLLQTIVALRQQRRLKRLEAVATMPHLRPRDGSVVQTPGYDEATGIHLDLKGVTMPRISDIPTRNEAQEALALLEALTEDFAFASSRDRTAALTGLLTAAVRTSIDVAPLIAFQGHSIGSGKTALATGLGALALGRLPGPEDASILADASETRKTITGHLRKPEGGVLLFDNGDGAQACSPLATLLTSAYWSARLLGESRIEAELPARTLVLLTGTGLVFQGDLARRAVLCRLEPRPADAQPVEDLAAVVLRERPAIFAAALTLIRAALTSGAPRAPGQVTSFPQWDRYVRQTVAWIGTHLVPGSHEDPLAIIHDETANATDRVELFDVLRALKDVFGDETFDAADVAARMSRNAPETLPIRAAAKLKGFFGEKDHPSAKTVGRMLAPRAGIEVEGLRLVAQRGRGMLHFRIEGEIE